jgi:hypothetical protein
MKKFLIPAFVLAFSSVAFAAPAAPAASASFTSKIGSCVSSCTASVSARVAAVKDLVVKNPKMSALVAVVAVYATYKAAQYFAASNDEEEFAN